MRNSLAILAALIEMGLAFWAYQENYKTQATLRELEKLHLAIAKEREALNMLKAEWAYLNRPENLRELAFINYDRLQLLPLESRQFGRVDQIPYPEAVPRLLGSVEVMGQEVLQ